MQAPSTPYVVTFVCAGNICRSPIAELVVADLVHQEGLGDLVVVDSAAIGDWHVGEHADPRALAILTAHGFDGSAHRARQLDPAELRTADLLVAMDSGQAAVLRAYASTPDDKAKVCLLREFAPAPDGHALDVADPYYGDEDDFATVVEQVRAAAPGLVAHVRAAVRSRRASTTAT